MNRIMKNKFDEELIFLEGNAAALSLKNGWTKLASTYGCMVVSLSQRHLIVKPRKSLDWLIKLFNLDLDHTILVGEITSIEKKGKSLGYREIRISFRNAEYQERVLLLYLRQYEKFLTAMKHLGIASESKAQ